MSKSSETAKSEVATRSVGDISALGDAELRNLSPENLEAFFASQGVEITDHSLFGSGFTLLKEKDQLVGRPFVIVEWRFAEGDFGTFVSALIMTAEGDKFVINDGSTGIRDQLLEVTKETGKRHAHKVKGGLTRSDYVYTNDKGVEIPASTYYLAN